MSDWYWFIRFLAEARERACRWGLCNGIGYIGGRCNICGWSI